MRRRTNFEHLRDVSPDITGGVLALLARHRRRDGEADNPNRARPARAPRPRHPAAGVPRTLYQTSVHQAAHECDNWWLRGCGRRRRMQLDVDDRPGYGGARGYHERLSTRMYYWYSTWLCRDVSDPLTEYEPRIPRSRATSFWHW